MGYGGSLGLIVIALSLFSVTLVMTSTSAFAGEWMIEPSSTIVMEHALVVNYFDEINEYEHRDQITLGIYTNAHPETLEIPMYRWDETKNFTSPLIIMTAGATDVQIPQINVNPSATVADVTIANDTSITGEVVVSNPYYFYGNWHYFTNAKIDSDWADCDDPALNLGGDSDKDGICDSFEDQDAHDGEVRVTYPNPADPYVWNCGDDCPEIGKKDFLLEIDYMEGHKPFRIALEEVKAAFERAGLYLHIQMDEQTVDHMDTVMVGGYWRNPGTAQIKNEWFGTADERGATPPVDGSNWELYGWKQKKQVFHYALFMNSQSGDPGASGTAELQGNDAFITLGAFDGGIGSQDQQAGTLLHELGHNLGLNHGGPWDDEINCKPNYISVMSYSRQFADLIPSRTLDFSSNFTGTMKGPGQDMFLDETALIDDDGISKYHDGPQPEIVYGDDNGNLYFSTTGVTSIDWPAQQSDISYIVDSGEVICNLNGNQILHSHNDTKYFEEETLDFRSGGNWASGRSGVQLDAEVTINANQGIVSGGTCSPSNNCASPQFIELPYQGYMAPNGTAIFNSTTLTWTNNDSVTRGIFFEFTTAESNAVEPFMINITAGSSFRQPFHDSGIFKFRDALYGDEGMIGVGNWICYTQQDIVKYNIDKNTVHVCPPSEMNIKDLQAIRLQKAKLIENEYLNLVQADYNDESTYAATKAEHLDTINAIKDAANNGQMYLAGHLTGKLKTDIENKVKPIPSQSVLEKVDNTRDGYSKAAAVNKPQLLSFYKLPEIFTKGELPLCGKGAMHDGRYCVPDGEVVCDVGTEFNEKTGQCEPDGEAVCGVGTEYDPVTKFCNPTDDPVDPREFCGKDSEFNDKTGKCEAVIAELDPRVMGIDPSLVYAGIGIAFGIGLGIMAAINRYVNRGQTEIKKASKE